ncbi:MAG: hypothetical protein K940chlam3_01126, partial [Chlamydiae bacterium]|nr:hypothetical protein [Chlamydiota bacterium]
ITCTLPEQLYSKIMDVIEEKGFESLHEQFGSLSKFRIELKPALMLVGFESIEDYESTAE